MKEVFIIHPSFSLSTKKSNKAYIFNQVVDNKWNLVLIKTTKTSFTKHIKRKHQFKQDNL